MEVNQIVEEVGAKKNILFIVLFVVIVAAAVWYFLGAQSKSTQTSAPATSTSTTSGGLGSELYQKSANPIQDKLPSSPASTPNPINGIYKNPFE